MDYYKNTIGDMQNEMDFFYHGKKFENIQDFEIFYETDYHKFLFFINVYEYR